MRLKAMSSLSLCAALVLVPGWAAAQDSAAKPAAPAKKQPAAPAMDEKAMMEKWMAAATPGAPHKNLARMEGTWTAKVKAWMDAAAPPMESEGTSENKMVLDGRFLEQRFQGSMMGQPFTGVGYTGYDNVQKKYVGSWVDSMGTALMYMEGTADATGKVITTSGRMPDALTGKVVSVKSVTTLVDPDHHQLEMWAPDPTGKVIKTLEIHYYRKK
jgi:hypothetical protein